MAMKVRVRALQVKIFLRFYSPSFSDFLSLTFGFFQNAPPNVETNKVFFSDVRGQDLQSKLLGSPEEKGCQSSAASERQDAFWSLLSRRVP